MPGRQLRDAGPSAVLIDCPDGRDATRLAAELLTRREQMGARDVVAGARTVLVTGEYLRRDLLRSAWTSETSDSDAAVGAKELVITVHFDGPDLTDPAIPELMCRDPWEVAFLGFAPGFAYLRRADVNPQSPLHLPRKAQSRSRIPAGSVALAAGYAAVYPRPSPGGWNLVGNLAESIDFFDPATGALLTPGMTVRFVEAGSR